MKLKHKGTKGTKDSQRKTRIFGEVSMMEMVRKKEHGVLWSAQAMLALCHAKPCFAVIVDWLGRRKHGSLRRSGSLAAALQSFAMAILFFAHIFDLRAEDGEQRKYENKL